MHAKKFQFLIRKHAADFGIVILLGFVGFGGLLRALESGNTLMVPFIIVAWLLLIFLFVRKVRMGEQEF